MIHVLQALKRAQAKIEDPKKSKVNPAFKSKYVDLNSVLAAIGEAVDEEGLVITQTVRHDAGQSFLVTQLYHAESAENIVSMFPLLGAANAQQLGSAITYARRYTLMAMFNLGTEDDDGNAAATGPAARPAPAQRQTAADLFISIAGKAKDMAEVEKAWGTLPPANRVGAAKAAYENARERLA